MEAEIISIGTEILLGQILNTNQQYLSSRLAALGIDVYRHSTVGDNPERLISAIRQGIERSDIVITTGGLGPTVDDITLKAIASAFSKKLIFNKDLAAQIKARFGRQCVNMPKENLCQAYAPEDAAILKNNEGTAPGFIIEKNGKIFIALPGPPRELKPMFDKYVLAYLKKKTRSGWIIKTRALNITGLPESAVDNKVGDLLRGAPPVTVGIFASPSLVELKITAKAKTEKQANALIDKMDKKIAARLGDYIFGRDNETLEGAVGQLLKRSGKTLAVAESLTGGLISSRITDVAGSSKYFMMGGVAYSNETKISKLKIPTGLIRKYGAVSREAAIKMAKNVREIVGTDYGLSVTGIAGPDGATKTKPVGLVHIAVSTQEETICRKFNFIGSRTVIKFNSSQAALDLLRKYLTAQNNRCHSPTCRLGHNVVARFIEHNISAQ
ncbi:MAG: competence/damage-inducible protein A [Candidatus Omnitrophota bacterium]